MRDPAFHDRSGSLLICFAGPNVLAEQALADIVVVGTAVHRGVGLDGHLGQQPAVNGRFGVLVALPDPVVNV